MADAPQAPAAPDCRGCARCIRQEFMGRADLRCGAMGIACAFARMRGSTCGPQGRLFVPKPDCRDNLRGEK